MNPPGYKTERILSGVCGAAQVLKLRFFNGLRAIVRSDSDFSTLVERSGIAL